MKNIIGMYRNCTFSILAFVQQSAYLLHLTSFCGLSETRDFHRRFWEEAVFVIPDKTEDPADKFDVAIGVDQKDLFVAINGELKETSRHQFVDLVLENDDQKIAISDFVGEGVVIGS